MDVEQHADYEDENHQLDLQSARRARNYRKICHLGEGQYAHVYLASKEGTDELFAIKKIKLGSRHDAKNGINRTALSEIKFLRNNCTHPNIVKLNDVFISESNISLVFEFLDTDLLKLITNNEIILSTSDMKCLILQMFHGIAYLHSKWILHRDLKPENMFIGINGVLKIGDFGLARQFGKDYYDMTSQVATRWYRAPELLFGARKYGGNVDVWSCGCIIGEMLQKAPLFPGESDLGQLSCIFDLLGTPKQHNWDSAKDLPDFVEYNPPNHDVSNIPNVLRNLFSGATEQLLILIAALLELDPIKRISAQSALQSKYFKEHPSPSEPIDLPLDKLKVPETKREKVEMSGVKKKLF